MMAWGGGRMVLDRPGVARPFVLSWSQDERAGGFNHGRTDDGRPVCLSVIPAAPTSVIPAAPYFRNSRPPTSVIPAPLSVIPAKAGIYTPPTPNGVPNGMAPHPPAARPFILRPAQDERTGYPGPGVGRMAPGPGVGRMGC